MCGVDSRLLSLSTFRRLRKSARSPGLTKSEKVPAPAGKPKAAVLAAMATFQLFPAKSYGICTISSFSSPSMSLKRTACGDERVRRVWRMEAHHIERPHLGTELEHMTAANIRADVRHAECSKPMYSPPSWVRRAFGCGDGQLGLQEEDAARISLAHVGSMRWGSRALGNIRGFRRGRPCLIASAFVLARRARLWRKGTCAGPTAPARLATERASSAKERREEMVIVTRRSGGDGLCERASIGR
jgi:hypothetical protein